MPVCHACGAPIEEPRAVSRHSVCESCGRDLRVCLNCKFYDPSAHWECHEDIPERVKEKDRANFCDYFMLPKGDSAYKGNAGEEKSSKARNDFLDLFGDG
ncbi:MAG: hypothetical protein GVY29_06530 [Spirochaetes bacterium]|nr:hypothetical protein [Spirochaetota bacterium]